MTSLRIFPRPSIREITQTLLSPCTQPHRCYASIPPARSSRSSVPKPSRSHTLRSLSSTSRTLAAPKSRDRGPSSTESTQTDFGSLDVLNNTPVPSTSIDACLSDGFHLNSGAQVVGGSGVLLMGGEAFGWKPWLAGTGGLRLLNQKGQWEVDDAAWGVLGLVWPKPDLLILGLGRDMRPLSPQTRRFLNSLGVRIEIQDTRNAAAQFNLLSMERGVGSVCAALIPIGWQEGSGC